MTEGMSLPPDVRMGPNCGVTAVAIVAGVSFETAWSVIKSIGRYRGNWKGKTTFIEREKALQALGVAYQHVGGFGSPRFRPTLQSWVRDHARPGVRYMVQTTGHIQVVCNGMVADQHGVQPVSKHWGRRKRVRDVIEIRSSIY